MTSEILNIDPTELQPGDVVVCINDHDEGGCHCDVVVTVRRDPDPEPGYRPTVVDVAQRASVSVKTVSRVLNKEPFVTSETAAKVHKAIRELGFVRNPLAYNLRAGVRARSRD